MIWQITKQHKNAKKCLYFENMCERFIEDDIVTCVQVVCTTCSTICIY